MDVGAQLPPLFCSPVPLVLTSCDVLEKLVLEIVLATRDRAGHAPTSIVRVDEIVPKLRRPERETAAGR